MKRSFTGILDRIEGKTAVVLVGEDALEMAKELLPEGAKEGDMISFKLELKDKKTKEEKEKMEKLIKKLSL
jgi:hypothetical protein